MDGKENGDRPPIIFGLKVAVGAALRLQSKGSYDSVNYLSCTRGAVRRTFVTL